MHNKERPLTPEAPLLDKSKGAFSNSQAEVNYYTGTSVLQNQMHAVCFTTYSAVLYEKSKTHRFIVQWMTDLCTMQAIQIILLRTEETSIFQFKCFCDVLPLSS